MKDDKIKFMKRGSLFILFFLIIFIALNNYYILKTSPGYNLDYAFFGDSHVRDGLNPEFIDNSFNFGNGEENYIETYYKIKKIIDGGIKINNFVLQLDPHTFSDKFRTNKELSIEKGHYNKAIPLIDAKKIKPDNMAQFLKVNYPMIGHGRELIAYSLNPQDSNRIESGWTNNTEKFNLKDKTDVASKRYNYFFSKTPNLLDNTTIKYFLKIFDIAKHENIGIIFIKYPVTKEYNIEFIKHNISIEDYYSNLFKEINKTFTKYVILDYYDDFFENPEYFGDSDHLNSLGSRVLSKKVWKEIQNKNLKK